MNSITMSSILIHTINVLPLEDMARPNVVFIGSEVRWCRLATSVLRNTLYNTDKTPDEKLGWYYLWLRGQYGRKADVYDELNRIADLAVEHGEVFLVCWCPQGCSKGCHAPVVARAVFGILERRGVIGLSVQQKTESEGESLRKLDDVNSERDSSGDSDEFQVELSLQLSLGFKECPQHGGFNCYCQTVLEREPVAADAQLDERTGV